MFQIKMAQHLDKKSLLPHSLAANKNVVQGRLVDHFLCHSAWPQDRRWEGEQQLSHQSQKKLGTKYPIKKTKHLTKHKNEEQFILTRKRIISPKQIISPKMYHQTEYITCTFYLYQHLFCSKKDSVKK